MKKLLLVIFSFFTYLKPAGFDLLGYTALNTFFNFARIVVTFFVIYYYFKANKHISNFLKYELLFFLCLGLSTVLSGEGFDKFFIFSVSLIALSMLIELLLKKNAMLMIKGMFVSYFILLSTNLWYMVSVFGFTINIEETRADLLDFGVVPTLLSSVNGVASYIFPGLCSAILLMFATSIKNVWAWMLIGIAFVSELIIWSATSLTGVFIILMYVLFVYRKKWERYMKSKLVVLGALGISLGVTFFNIQYLFEFIIVDILHKDLSMTGRTTVWNIGYDGFYSSPIIGCGIASTTVDNAFVQVLYTVGVVGTLFFCFFMIYCLRTLFNMSNQSYRKFFSIVIAAVFLMFMAESWTQFYGLYVILTLCVNADKIGHELRQVQLRKYRYI